MVDADDGSLAASYTYDPFGNILSSAGVFAGINPFRFSTKYLDFETGLYYYGYRFFIPELGRWVNRDPMEEEGGLNLYVFAKNGPINLFDLLGLKGIGHHIIPWHLFDGGKVADAVKTIWDSPAARIYDKAYKTHNAKSLKGVSHRLYNKLVKKELEAFLKVEKTCLKNLTTEQAIKFLKQIKYNPTNGAISLFNIGVLLFLI